MNIPTFKEKLLKCLQENSNKLQDEKSNWAVKGFIDIYKNIYTINCDTKVISKVLELMIFPILIEFAKENNFDLEYAAEQNYYPDTIFIDKTTKEMYAVDLKTTYRINNEKVNGFTLGAFTGYFRDRNSNKNIVYTYNSYKAHIVLGIIYSKNEIDDGRIYNIDEVDKIMSSIYNFDFIVQEKYRLASTRPGSGNTKNIGSITDINNLKKGEGPFYKLGEEIFDDYWMYYMTRDMSVEGIQAYNNLETYMKYKNKAPKNIDGISEE